MLGRLRGVSVSQDVMRMSSRASYTILLVSRTFRGVNYLNYGISFSAGAWRLK